MVRKAKDHTVVSRNGSLRGGWRMSEFGKPNVINFNIKSTFCARSGYPLIVVLPPSVSKSKWKYSSGTFFISSSPGR